MTGYSSSSTGTDPLISTSSAGHFTRRKFTSQIHGNWGGADPLLVGKSMVVQISNIGGDVTGDHSFDIQIPGAGQGIFHDGCSAQFSGYSTNDFDCGKRYGGCDDRSGCSRLPADLQSGCHWRYDWLEWLHQAGQTNNPYVKFRRVRCPSHLTNISGSVPLDDHLVGQLDLDDFN